MRNPVDACINLLRRLLVVWLALILLFEEWLWDTLTVMGSRLALRLHLERLEAFLAKAPRGLALAAFLVPLIVVTPLNIAALWMIASGMLWQGILLEVVAKLLGTLLIARVFALTRAQLLTFAWFAWLHTHINRWLTWAREKIRQTRAYAMVRALEKSTRHAFGQWRVQLAVFIGRRK